MPAIARQRITSEPAAQELWRVADSGDVDELRRILPQAGNVNAHNKNGVTALMRAAYHGHARIARALLEHGADPNLKRNDKFTALALAAFFGHTETVRVLIEHGAQTEAVTRCGASAQMWATARTFEEAARCLELHSPAPAPAPLPVPSRTTSSVVKTLKDPPEIWDLVQEVPRGFDARSAFFSRLKSMKTNFVLRTAAVLVVSAACVVGVLVLRGSKASSLQPGPVSHQSTADNQLSAPESMANSDKEPPVNASESEVGKYSHHSGSNDVSEKPSRRLNSLTRQTRSRPTPDEEPVQSIQTSEAPAVPSAVASPRFEPRNSNKANSSLSPQLISPARGAPPKAKVIQWP